MIDPAQLTGLRVLVVGAAREGTAASAYLARHGAHVRLADAQPLDALRQDVAGLATLGVVLEGGVAQPSLADLDLVVLSPGVPPSAPLVQEARRLGLPLSSEPRLFTQLFRGTILGVTGSSGKTTTTTLLGEMLTAAGRKTLVGGNIGLPLISTLDGDGASAEAAVMELSSFQLELFSPAYQGEGVESARSVASRAISLAGWSPPLSLVTNVTPNHLDRHPSMADYVRAKSAILAYQQPGDWAVLNADDPISQELHSLVRGQLATFSLVGPVAQGAYLAGDALVVRWAGREAMVCRRGELRLRGEHNVANVLAACCLAAAAGVPPEAMRAVATTFRGVPHRLEVVRVVDGVTWINDSIATSPERATAALKAFDEPVVLLAGGRDKHLPWADWARWAAAKARLVIGFGECAPLVEGALAALGEAAPAYRRTDRLPDAVQLAAELARPGDVVLLSPGGTSFDAYRDFEERGEAFRQLVRSLA
ncbi:MAG: UDP-N-acetylmuramoyl-L-alanine--D-glutamate ligase [Anaerolineales bacterium]